MEKLGHCTICKKNKPASEFYFNKGRPYGGFLHSRCKSCDKERSKARREYMRNYMRQDAKKNPQKWAARIQARTQLKKQPCKICGSLKSEAHHPDHSKPLEVVWLCHAHHFKVERGALKVN